jgi:3-oxoacyl-[acyl-carrier-protein] synthase-3
VNHLEILEKENSLSQFKHLKTAAVSGVGIAVPERILSNKDLEKLVDTSDEWIVTRTGIRERRIADPNIATSDLSIEASQKALKEAQLSPEELDLIIVCTVTPDTLIPSCSCLVQNKLGAKRAAACDIVAGCTGFMYGLAMGSQFIATGLYKNVLVIGADTLSRILDWNDRSTCILFGDGAGAVVLSPSKKEGFGLLNFYLRADGSGGNLLVQEAGGSRMPATLETVQNKKHFLKMEGKQVFKFAVNAIVDGVNQALLGENLSLDDIDCFLFHQANIRILESAAKLLKIPMEKIFTNVDRYGNTSSASIPLAFMEAREQKKFKDGSYVIMVGFGAGLTWASTLMRW